jgi:hypothetical protein
LPGHGEQKIRNVYTHERPGRPDAVCEFERGLAAATADIEDTFPGNGRERSERGVAERFDLPVELGVEFRPGATRAVVPIFSLGRVCGK